MQRIQSFDLARGFTVLAMPMIHTIMLYSTPEVHASLLGIILRFIAEGPGAQLFMLFMGINFAFKLASGTAVLKRAVYLLVAAYLLNIAKFIIPLSFKLLPAGLLTELQLSNDIRSAAFFLFIGDILHFAALASVILWLVTRTRFYPVIAILLASTVIFISPYLWDRSTGLLIADHFIGLFNAHPPQTFFPVFPWLVYTLIGLPLGYAFTRFDKEIVFKWLAFAGTALIVFSLTLPVTPPETNYLAFYRSRPADTLFHLGFVMIWISLIEWLSKKLPANPVFSLLTFCSKHITAIYIIQWILICWCMAFTGYGSLDLASSLLWMVAITFVTLLLTLLFTVKRSHAHRKSI